jgi:hypothetical protein
MPARQIAGGSHDAGSQISVEQEVLTKRTPRIQSVARDDRAQRWQIVDQAPPRKSMIARRRNSRCNWREASSTRSPISWL